MKKAFTWVLLFLMAFNCFPQLIYAAETPKYELSVNTNVIVDDEFTVNVNIKGNPGLITLKFKIIYDADYLQLISVEDSKLLNSYNPPSPEIKSPYTLSWIDPFADVNNTSNGTVATLKFKALKSGNSLPIQIEHSECRNKDGEKITFSGTSKNIDIKSKPIGVTGVNLSQKELSLKSGESENLTATVTPSNATNKAVTWKSDNASVATVNNGTVQALGNGTATITVTTADGGYTDTCVVTVSGGHEHTDADGKWESNATQHFHTCECGAILDRENHGGGNATCTNKAICSVCGVEYGELNPENHTGETEIKNAVEATCDADGYTGDTYCKGCGTKIKDGDIIPASHRLTKVEAKEATDDAAGNIEYWVCSDCSKIFGDAEGKTEITLEETVIYKALIGDVNEDGKVTVVDAKWILQHISGTRQLTEKQQKAADLNADGKITVVDAKWVLQIVSGLRKG